MLAMKAHGVEPLLHAGPCALVCAVLQVVSLVQSLPESQRTKQLKLGIDEVGLGSPPGGQGYDARVFVARNMQLAHAPSTQQPVLVAATHEVSSHHITC